MMLVIATALRVKMVTIASKVSWDAMASTIMVVAMASMAPWAAMASAVEMA